MLPLVCGSGYMVGTSWQWMCVTRLVAYFMANQEVENTKGSSHAPGPRLLPVSFISVQPPQHLRCPKLGSPSGDQASMEMMNHQGLLTTQRSCVVCKLERSLSPGSIMLGVICTKYSFDKLEPVRHHARVLLNI